MKLTKKNQSVLDGKRPPAIDYVKNDDGSITIGRGIISYEDFHELLNHLFVSPKIFNVDGKNEDFVIVPKKIRIRI